MPPESPCVFGCLGLTVKKEANLFGLDKLKAHLPNRVASHLHLLMPRRSLWSKTLATCHSPPATGVGAGYSAERSAAGCT